MISASNAILRWEPPALLKPRTSLLYCEGHSIGRIHKLWFAGRGADVTCDGQTLHIRNKTTLMKRGYEVTDSNGYGVGLFTPESVSLLPHGTFTTTDHQRFQLSGGQTQNWVWYNGTQEIISYLLSTRQSWLKPPAIEIHSFETEKPGYKITALLGIFLITTFAHEYASGD